MRVNILVAFEQAWAGQLFGPGIGPVLILLGSSMIGVPAFIGFNGDVLEG